MNKSETRDFERQMQAVLRSSEYDLDMETSQSLANARAEALKGLKKPLGRRFFMPMTGMALASIVAVVLVLSPNLKNEAPSMQNSSEVMFSESIDLYEDMEFYSWLASNDSNLNG